MAERAASSRWWIWALALGALLLVIVFGVAGVGLALLVGRGRPAGMGVGSVVDETGNVLPTVRLAVVGQRVTLLGSNVEVLDPCSVEGADVEILADLGTHATVQGLIDCLKARGVRVYVDGVRR